LEAQETCGDQNHRVWAESVLGREEEVGAKQWTRGWREFETRGVLAAGTHLGSFSSEGRSPFLRNGPTYTFLPFSSMPLTASTAFDDASSVSKCTKPYPFDLPPSVATCVR